MVHRAIVHRDAIRIVCGVRPEKAARWETQYSDRDITCGRCMRSEMARLAYLVRAGWSPSLEGDE